MIAVAAAERYALPIAQLRRIRGVHRSLLVSVTTLVVGAGVLLLVVTLGGGFPCGRTGHLAGGAVLVAVTVVIGVQALAQPEFLIEVEAIAVVA